MNQRRGPRRNLVGETFGRWTVLAFAGYGDREQLSKNAMWSCVCECGTKRDVLGRNMIYGLTKACGCVSSEMTTRRNKTHGMSESVEYTAWVSMWGRVRAKEGDKDFARYGGRGIACCDRWKSFEAFYEDMGPRPPGHSIDRIDNDLGYSPENCRWTTAKRQARNRVSSRIVSAFGESLPLADWAERFGVQYQMLWARIFVLNWSPEEALTSAERKFACPSI